MLLVCKRYKMTTIKKKHHLSDGPKVSDPVKKF